MALLDTHNGGLIVVAHDSLEGLLRDLQAGVYEIGVTKAQVQSTDDIRRLRLGFTLSYVSGDPSTEWLFQITLVNLKRSDCPYREHMVTVDGRRGLASQIEAGVLLEYCQVIPAGENSAVTASVSASQADVAASDPEAVQTDDEAFRATSLLAGGESRSPT